MVDERENYSLDKKLDEAQKSFESDSGIEIVQIESGKSSQELNNSVEIKIEIDQTEIPECEIPESQLEQITSKEILGSVVTSGSPEVKVEPTDEVLATENAQNSKTQNRIFENSDIKDEFSEDEIEELVLDDTPIYRSVNLKLIEFCKIVKLNCHF